MGEYFVPTKSCPSASSHEVYEFSGNHTKRKSIGTDKESSEGPKTEEVDMKQARFEVYKFSQSGLSNPERHKSQLELAMKLGAIPRKNKCINYKDFKEKRKQEKRKMEEQCLLDKTTKAGKKGKPKGSKNNLHKKRKMGTGILKSYGKMK